MINKLKNLYYDTKYGIQNLCRWIPIIWELRDWDAHGLYSLIERHLEHIEECIIDSDTLTYEAKEQLSNIEKCIFWARNLKEDQYVHRAIQLVEKKYGPSKSHIEVRATGYNRWVNDNSPEHISALSRAYDMANQAKETEKQSLFTMVFQNIDKWWD